MVVWQDFGFTELIEDRLPAYVKGWMPVWCGRDPHDVYKGWLNNPLSAHYQITSCEETHECGTHGGCSYCLMSKVRFDYTPTPCHPTAPGDYCGGASVTYCYTTGPVRLCTTPLGISGPCTTPRVCTPGETKCEGDRKLQCNADGSAWVDIGPCPICTPTTEKCEGGTLSRCSDDGTAWNPVGTCSILDTPTPGATHYVQIIGDGVILYNSWCSLTKTQVTKLLTLANQTGFGGGGGGGRK